MGRPSMLLLLLLSAAGCVGGSPHADAGDDAGLVVDDDDDAGPDGDGDAGDGDAGVEPDGGSVVATSCLAPRDVVLGSLVEVAATDVAQAESCGDEAPRALLRLTLDEATTVVIQPRNNGFVTLTESCGTCGPVYGYVTGWNCVECPPAAFVGELRAGTFFLSAFQGPATDADYGLPHAFTVSFEEAPFACAPERIGDFVVDSVCTLRGFERVCEDFATCQYGGGGSAVCDVDPASPEFNRCVDP